MVVINDISDRMKHREAIVSEKMKTIMICSISHELRSPLNQINGMISLIEPELTKPEHQEYIRIANSALELLRLKIEDIMSYYEVETNTFKATTTELNIRMSCLMLESLFQPMINTNLIKLRFFVESSVPNVIHHDANRIRGILVTFLSNAIKYTKKGVVSVIISLVNHDKKNSDLQSIKFAVSDSG